MSDSRLFKILYFLISKGHATAPELAEEFEVSVRTVYRDIEALSSAGIPVYTQPGRMGGICLLQGSVLERTVFSNEEKEAMLTALQSGAATGYLPGEALRTKLSALFGMEAADWLEVEFSRWGRHTGDIQKFETLKMAVLEHRTLKIKYASAQGQRSERMVQPLRLAYKSKEWYLKAFCLDREDFRIFKLNRILALEVLKSTFVPRPYPEEAGEEQRYPEIVLRVSGEAAYRVYDEFDEEQVECQEDGSFLVTAEIPVDAWLVGYLLSFGTQLEVVKPKYLREMLAAQARKIYEKNKP